MKKSQQMLGDLNNPAIQEIKAAMKMNKSLRMHERYQTILMYLHDVPHKEISKVTRLSLSTVYNYVNAYQQDGIAGLAMGTHTGRPRLLTPEQEQQVKQMVVNQVPVDVGFPAEMNWTSPLVRKWIEKKYGVLYSDRGTRELMYRLQLSFTKPTYTLAKADPVKQEAFRQEFEVTKKNS